MAKKQILILFLLVCLPLGLLAWLGGRLAREERDAVEQRFQNLLTAKLKDSDQLIENFFDRRLRELLKTTNLKSFDTSQLRELIRFEPTVRQLFVLDSQGLLVHPNPAEPLNDSEKDFISRAKQLLLDKDLVRIAGLTSASTVPSVPTANNAETGTPQSSHGWYVWYWGRGLHLIFWRRTDDDHLVGVTLERSRWISDLIAHLPDTIPRVADDNSALSNARVQLVDSNDSLVHQWGPFEPNEKAQPLAEIPVGAPLSSWRLKYHLAENEWAAGTGGTVYFNVFSTLAVMGVALGGLAIYLYRGHAREMHEASQRVNFVNQVSHELKTPLTNIRMYADLMELDLQAIDAESAAKPHTRLKVIISESQRLSRLIGNVLTFAKQQRGPMKLRLRTGQVDQVVRAVIDRFEPTMSQKEIRIELVGMAAETVQLDVDALEQILVNLLSNVEKYAAAGKVARIETRHKSARTIITVEDDGPGIPRDQRDRVFQPFHRLSDELVGPAGTGIGLSIARGLARMHGGDLTLQQSEIGACFRVELHTPLVETKP